VFNVGDFMLKFDHIVIVVHDLDEATANYTALGFTVFYGGKHASGTTHNALIVFGDGTYLELLAPTGDKAPASSTTNFADFFGQREGLAGFALQSDDLAAQVAVMRGRGVEVSDPRPGGRVRPDGVELHWQTAMLEGTASPFFIQDDTPRVLRVPDDPNKTQHANGVTGLGGLTLVVDSRDMPVGSYEDILGIKAKVDESRARFVLNSVVLRLSKPTDEEMKAHLAQFGASPYLLALRTHDSDLAGQLDLTKTHGARIALVE
jgi:catechol 2,3-dioxygenase-like lactoylglutathione lyase family enzyme